MEIINNIGQHTILDNHWVNNNSGSILYFIVAFNGEEIRVPVIGNKIQELLGCIK